MRVEMNLCYGPDTTLDVSHFISLNPFNTLWKWYLLYYFTEEESTKDTSCGIIFPVLKFGVSSPKHMFLLCDIVHYLMRDSENNHSCKLAIHLACSRHYD